MRLDLAILMGTIMASTSFSTFNYNKDKVLELFQGQVIVALFQAKGCGFIVGRAGGVCTTYPQGREP